MMERDFDFFERVSYNHTIRIIAESEEELDEIEEALGYMIDENDIECKEDLFSEIKRMGGDYEFVEDGSPDVEYE